MNDAFDAVLLNHAFDEIFVASIANEQRHALGQESGKSGGQVVDHDNAFAGFSQRMNHVTSDIASTAGNEHGHIHLSRHMVCQSKPSGLGRSASALPKVHAPLFRGDASRGAVKSGFRRP